ncbi:hypothetical protein PCO31111_00888 [Pandoraea communis]|uniref:Uncharacterized protein n=1 Tax=Pandoraea communis TaxID=2508297 RepID=A0A5E4SQH3_9BURK|nr:hypothetical protein PCO31111_00888 [Pandoraea communis]
MRGGASYTEAGHATLNRHLSHRRHPLSASRTQGAKQVDAPTSDTLDAGAAAPRNNSPEPETMK